MRIEPYQGGYRMVPSTSAASPVQRAQEQAASAAANSPGQCDSCDAPVAARDVDRVELTSIRFADPPSAPPRAGDSQQRIRENLVAGTVDQRIEFDLPGGRNPVLDRAYFISERSLADFNAAAVGRAVDVSG